ncbi:unnamed protein product [Fusarium graminearum]|uniref:Chromosome 3, complete genome n=1 Tax=Gibberella zeae (strain ATCC MYA-4620 / CBS 123657 / FGSC 9075 / NRRL 31084 / PH-1) TaxID=229533 RepID=A0A0E0SP00_GIBZE|nr:hypothetical protein FG05_35031 [Fusarium graminearum]CEF88163.1 unnamed protein product [Fusarium graminearum]CZS85002.1 unnamed protein product [Fusarium graminearum]
MLYFIGQGSAIFIDTATYLRLFAKTYTLQIADKATMRAAWTRIRACTSSDTTSGTGMDLMALLLRDVPCY